jgi:hypothetical protein
MYAKAPGDERLASVHQSDAVGLRIIIIAAVVTLATPAFAQTKPAVANGGPGITGIAEPGSYLCDETQDAGISCHPTPLLPCGSPVPMRGGSESMAHSYCESQIPDRVKDQPGRNLYPRRNAIVTCMTKWRKSNQLGLALAQKNSSSARVARQPNPREAAQERPPVANDSQSHAEPTPQIGVEKPAVSGIAGAGSYSCDRSKGDALKCQPIPVLSCGTSKLTSIDTEAKALANCENFVPQSIQDDPGRRLFPRKTALGSCMNRWRGSKERDKLRSK